jgi:alkylation response protein AidB-like acyl-CoA dehydrogenase
MLIGVELACSAAVFARWCADENHDALRIAAPLAYARCSAAAIQAAKHNIQIHGGIGFTWEHPAHLYLRRAKASARLLGPPSAAHVLVARGLETHLGGEQ